MADDLQTVANMLKTEGCFDGIANFLNKFKLLLGPLEIFVGYVDLVKDCILLNKLVTTLGGIYVIILYINRFSSVVSFCI